LGLYLTAQLTDAEALGNITPLRDGSFNQRSRNI